MRNCLVLVQHRESSSSAYNDFIGKFYHFPGNKNKSYLSQFKSLPVEFVYYEPTANGGKGEYFGYGVIRKKPFEDKREEGHFFAEIEDYKSFKNPVPYKNKTGAHVEEDSPHYNAQNAVRKIAPKLLDEICLDGEIQLSFRADAHLIKVLGEQLIASEKVGILELIKNAYDAHATHCIVRLEKSKNLPDIPNADYTYPDLAGPVVIVEDDGAGMDRATLENGWLRPASTIKTNVKERLKLERRKAIDNGSLATYESLIKELKKANRNRIPLGEKGVGRFATHRLGRNLIIKTKVADLDYEYLLEIDWDEFDKLSNEGVDLHSIGVSLKRQPPSRDYGDNNSGTQIIIFGGRDGFEWDTKKIEDLNRAVIQLNSPNPSPKSTKHTFSAELVVPQIPDMGSDSAIQFEPTFEFNGLVDEKGILDYSLKFTPPKSVPMSSSELSDRLNLKACDPGYWAKRPQSQQTECGPFYMHIKLWYRRAPWVVGPEAKLFFERLDRYGGISLYRDGICILPAESSVLTDWLDLAQAHIKQGFRFSYYNMLGNIEFDQGSNIFLTDKTNREGLIENRAYYDLVALVKSILSSIIENEWVAKRDEYTNLTKDVVRDPKVLNEYVRQSAAITKSIKEDYPVEKDPYGILSVLGSDPLIRERQLINLTRSMKDLKTSLKLIEESQDMLTEQAGYGLAVAASVHEINKITSNFFYGINQVLKKDVLDKEKLEELRDSSSSLRSELKRLAPLRALRAEDRTEFKVSRPISFAFDVYKNRIAGLNIEFVVDKASDFQVYARYGAVVQIFTNLLDNACYWLEMEDKAERRISVKIDGEYRTVVFADSGPGVHDSMLPHLFKPGYSMKIPRSGLGLYISQHYMQDMKGDINLLSNPKFRIESMPGAQFLIDFNRVKTNKG